MKGCGTKHLPNVSLCHMLMNRIITGGLSLCLFRKLAEVDGGVIGGGGIAITSCVACGKKFANQWLSSDQAFCRSCRLSPNKIAAATSGNHTPSGLQDGSSEGKMCVCVCVCVL